MTYNTGTKGIVKLDPNANGFQATFDASALTGNKTITITDAGVTTITPVWGTITGDLADQTDLQSSLDSLSSDIENKISIGDAPSQDNDRADTQTAANTNILTHAVGASDGTFQVMANVLVTTSTLHSITVTVDYTDESNTSRTLTLPFSQLAGTIITTITNGTGAGPYEGIPLTIRAKASTNIVFKTAGTFTTITYNVDCSTIQIN